MADWKVGYCEYTSKGQTGGQVLVTTLHYNVSLTDGEYFASSYGTTPDTGNRVYALPALQAVPEHVMVKWVTDALGEEEVAEIEQRLKNDIELQKNPVDGGFSPSDGDEIATQPIEE